MARKTRTTSKTSPTTTTRRSAPAARTTRRTKTPPGPDSRRVTPAPDHIATRAYHIYLERGGGHGLDMDDWLQAERELAENQELAS